MSKTKHDENYYRRLAFKFFDKDKSANQILKEMPRKRSWLFKWKRRFIESGWAALESSCKAPKTSPQQYPQATRQLVLKMRLRMAKAKVGLCGARALRSHLQQHRVIKQIPSLSTIKRWLRDEGFFQSKEHLQRKPYYPVLNFSDSILFASADWIARYITGGEKVFVFHTIDMQTHALSQSIETNKTATAACAHLLQSLRELGLIDFLQVDNDAAFTGLGIKPRIFGQFVRVALYFGVELIFIPPGEPKRNGVVERINGLWASAFWDRDHFSGIGAVKRKRGKFLSWYLHYAPPALQGKSVKEACQEISRRRLSARECQQVPENLPLTMGRIHYYRKVDEAGCIDVLKEEFRVSKSLRGEYVIATIDVTEQSLTIHYRRSPQGKAKLLKQFAYTIEEPRAKLKTKYKRGKQKRVDILQII